LTFTVHPFAGSALGPIFTLFGVWGPMADVITLVKF